MWFLCLDVRNHIFFLNELTGKIYPIGEQFAQQSVARATIGASLPRATFTLPEDFVCEKNTFTIPEDYFNAVTIKPRVSALAEGNQNSRAYICVNRHGWVIWVKTQNLDFV